MDLALVVIPDFAAWSGEDGLDREQEAHLLWLEDAALRIDEGAAFAFEKKTSLQVFPRQRVMHGGQPAPLHGRPPYAAGCPGRSHSLRSQPILEYDWPRLLSDSSIRPPMKGILGVQKGPGCSLLYRK